MGVWLDRSGSVADEDLDVKAERRVEAGNGRRETAIFRLFESYKVPVAEAPDPTALPKACKTAAELDGMRKAHLRDAVAMARILHWIDTQAPDGFDEIDVVRTLEGFRREAGAYDLSFDTICGIGANAALPHYRVSLDSNTRARPGRCCCSIPAGNTRKAPPTSPARSSSAARRRRNRRTASPACCAA